MGGISIWQLLIVVVIVVSAFRDEKAELAGVGFGCID
ncbi:twin arginine translocase protein A [Raoultella ornithinolytica]|nr:twin arginine translocase protein A [Raoultella ornithinolytica]